MMHLVRRILAYLKNDMSAAEAFEPPAVGQPPQWIVDAAGDDLQAQTAVEIATRSYEIAESALHGLQERASSHVTLLLAILPFALGATAVSLPPQVGPSPMRLIAFGGFIAADIALLLALVLATLATGLSLGGGISIDRLGSLADSMATQASGPRTAALRAAEAEALRYATALAFASGKRVAADLYASRRLGVIALLTATGSVVLLVLSAGGMSVFLANP